MRKNFLQSFRQHSKRISIVTLIVLVFVLLGRVAPEARASGSFSSSAAVKDTMTNDRPSVSTTLTGSHAIGSTTFTVASTTGILPGDSVTFVAGTPETLVVATIISSTQLTTTTASTILHSSGAVYMRQTSVHTIALTTRSTVATGSFDVIFTGATTSTGVPTNQFDFNSLAAGDVSVTGFTAVVKTITAASGKVNITFTASIAASTAITIVIGSTNKLLNPIKTAASGTADTWGLVINENDTTPAIIDAASISVATIESVSVTATVTPTLSFKIFGVANGTSVAGKSTNTTSTTVTVPFGTLTASVQQYIAQYLQVTTNSSLGYSVTTYEDGALRKTTGTTITDFSTTAAEHNNTDGFGFSLANKTGSPCISTLLYNASARTLNGSGFGSSGTPIAIMSANAAVTTDECYVVYDLQVAASQAPGDYQNLVTYIATGLY